MTIRSILISGLALTAISAAAMATDATKPATVPTNDNKPKMERPLRWDDNKDGVISKDEWTKHQDEKFGEIDANKDGKITPDEMKSHGKAMREKMKKLHDKMKDAQEGLQLPKGEIRPITMPSPELQKK